MADHNRPFNRERVGKSRYRFGKRLEQVGIIPIMGKTAHHVHAGLAGFYLIEDENSQALDLPKEYGVNDIPLVVQDRSFTDGKMNEYSVTVEDIMNGLREDTLVVNGTVDAYHNVPQGWVRLRLLNGSNARFYRFHFGNDVTFFKIATEGGFLNQPVEMEFIDMAPGERNEIMIDLSDGENATLIADLLPADPEDSGFWTANTPQVNVVELRVDPTLQLQARYRTHSMTSSILTGQMPRKSEQFPWIWKYAVAVRKTWICSGSMGKRWIWASSMSGLKKVKLKYGA
jgi:FtsP/CotA-like multicopper oxidase with cupredoxin domain